MLDVMSRSDQAGASSDLLETVLMLYLRSAESGQGAVIIAASHAKTITAVVKCYQRHEHQVHVCSR